MNKIKKYIKELSLPKLTKAKDCKENINNIANQFINDIELTLNKFEPIVTDTSDGGNIIYYAVLENKTEYNYSGVKDLVIHFYKEKGKWDDVIISTQNIKLDNMLDNMFTPVLKPVIVVSLMLHI